MKVADLRKKLKAIGADTTGTKAVLVARFQSHQLAETPSAPVPSASPAESPHTQVRNTLVSAPVSAAPPTEKAAEKAKTGAGAAIAAGAGKKSTLATAREQPEKSAGKDVSSAGADKTGADMAKFGASGEKESKLAPEGKKAAAAGIRKVTRSDYTEEERMRLRILRFGQGEGEKIEPEPRNRSPDEEKMRRRKERFSLLPHEREEKEARERRAKKFGTQPKADKKRKSVLEGTDIISKEELERRAKRAKRFAAPVANTV